MNKFSDVTPLQGLTNLSYLDLIDNNIGPEAVESLRAALPNCSIEFYE